MKLSLKTPKKYSLGLLVLLLLSSLWASAQNNHYQIELIIASHINKEALMEEAWPELSARPLPYYDAFPLPALAEDASYLEYKPLAESKWQLKHAKTAFEGLKHHKILFHNAWQQPISQQSQNPYLFIFSDNILSSAALAATEDAILPPRELEGRIQLSQGRHLHLELDLSLRIPAQVIERIQPKTRFQSNEQKNEAEDSTFSWFKRAFTPKQKPAFYLFRLETSRKIRPGEVHLFDHPLYSILAMVTEAPKHPVQAMTPELSIE